MFMMILATPSAQRRLLRVEVVQATCAARADCVSGVCTHVARAGAACDVRAARPLRRMGEVGKKCECRRCLRCVKGRGEWGVRGDAAGAGGWGDVGDAGPWCRASTPEASPKAKSSDFSGSSSS